MSFPPSRETQRAARGCAPSPPAGDKAKTGRIAFAAFCRSLHTPSQRPTAVGGQRSRNGRITFADSCGSLHTPCGLLSASVRRRW